MGEMTINVTQQYSNVLSRVSLYSELQKSTLKAALGSVSSPK